MQSNNILDYPGFENSENFDSVSTMEKENFSKKKRKRGGKTKGYSKKEEERILKHALKLSEKEYLEKNAKSLLEPQKIRYCDIKTCKTVTATEEDFLNPINFFDNLWDESSPSTGVIKIIPPKNWVTKQKEYFECTFRPKFQDKDKKLTTRKQTLDQLYLAKVRHLSYKNIFPIF